MFIWWCVFRYRRNRWFRFDASNAIYFFFLNLPGFSFAEVFSCGGCCRRCSGIHLNKSIYKYISVDTRWAIYPLTTRAECDGHKEIALNLNKNIYFVFLESVTTRRNVFNTHRCLIWPTGSGIRKQEKCTYTYVIVHTCTVYNDIHFSSSHHLMALNMYI